MARHDLYIDIDRGEVVGGPTDTSLASLPPFVQGDSLSLRVYFLRGFSRASTYTQVPVSGLTVEMALGAKVGDQSLLYTQQFSWTASTDLGQPYFAAVLPMNTAGITELLGAAAKADAWLEIKVIEDALSRTVLSKLVSIQAAVIKADSLTVPAGLTPLYAETAGATFLTRVITGRIRIMDDSGYGTELYTDAAGVFHMDPITP